MLFGVWEGNTEQHVHHCDQGSDMSICFTVTSRLSTLAHFLALPILMRMPLMLDFLRPAYDSRMFCGFRSRWMMPLLLRMRMAAAICWRKTLSVSSLSVPLAKKKDPKWHLKNINKDLQQHQLIKMTFQVLPAAEWNPIIYTVHK